MDGHKFAVEVVTFSLCRCKALVHSFQFVAAVPVRHKARWAVVAATDGCGDNVALILSIKEVDKSMKVCSYITRYFNDKSSLFVDIWSKQAQVHQLISNEKVLTY
jgi:hypothetical protein